MGETKEMDNVVPSIDNSSQVSSNVHMGYNSSPFFIFYFRFYINVYTMYVCHSCDEKSLFFVDFLINTIKIFPCNTICGNVCTIERILKGTMKIHCTRTRHGQQ